MSENIPNVAVLTPNQFFANHTTTAGGKIYIGKANMNPREVDNQVNVYVEDDNGSMIVVNQPLIVNSAGFLMYNGKVAQFMTEESHSMAIYDSSDIQLIHIANVLDDGFCFFNSSIDNNHIKNDANLSFFTGLFKDALNASVGACQTIITSGHSQVGIGGSVYYRNNRTGMPSTGNEVNFFDADGVGWTIVTDGKLRYTQFGIGANNNQDDIPKLKLAHDTANERNVSVYAGGKLTIIADSVSQIEVKTSVDFSGSCFIVRDGASSEQGGIFLIKPSKNSFAMSSDQIALLQPQLKEQEFNFPALQNNKNIENSLIIVKNSEYLSRRTIGDNKFDVFKEDSFVHLRDGNCIGALLCDHTSGTLTIQVKPLEDSWLSFGNVNYIQDFSDTSKRCTFVKTERNQTKYNRIYTNTNLIVDSGSSSSIIQASRVAFLTFEDIGGENMNAGTNGNSGYCISHQHAVCVEYQRVSLNSGWGVINTNWIKEWIVSNSYLNRIDNHYGIGNLTISNCRLISENVQIGFGGGRILLDNVTVTAGLNAYIPDHDEPIELGMVNLRAGWQLGYRGDIIINDSTMCIPGDLPTKAKRNFIGGVNYGQQKIAGCDPTIPFYLPNVSINNFHLTVVGNLTGKLDFFGVLLWDNYLYNSRIVAPDRISIHGMSSNNSSVLLDFKPFKGLGTNVSQEIWDKKTCRVDISDVSNNLSDIDRGSIVLDKYDEWKFNKSLFDWGSMKVNQDNSRVFWDVKVINCVGSLYLNSTNSVVRVDNSEIVDIKTYYSNINYNINKITNSIVWPKFRLSTDYEWYFSDNNQSQLMQGCEIVAANLDGLTVSGVSLRPRQRLVDCFTAYEAPINQEGVNRLWKSFETATDMLKKPL